MHINVLTMHGIGSATFTAANGTPCPRAMTDRRPDGSHTLSIVEVYTITGGTERLLTRHFHAESPVDQTTGVSSGTFSGAIDH